MARKDYAALVRLWSNEECETKQYHFIQCYVSPLTKREQPEQGLNGEAGRKRKKREWITMQIPTWSGPPMSVCLS